MADDTVRIGALALKFLVDERASAGKTVVFEMTVPAEARVPAAHHHREVDEVFYGLEGTLTDMDVDSDAGMVVSHGAVDLLLSDGTTIVADSMVRDGNAQLWTFTRATVVVPDLPAAAR